MARRIRVKFPGALYHITDRGNERKTIFVDEQDRYRFLKYVGDAVDHFSLQVHAFCLMPNHYHLEIETPKGNISRAMHWLNTIYTVNFNGRHRRIGHLLEVTRYIHLNPVRADLVDSPEAYRWSSYRDYIGYRKRWKWLETGWVLDRFGDVERRGKQRYRQFVEEGLGCELANPMKEATAGIVLGSERFVDWVQEEFLERDGDTISIPLLKQFRKVSVEKVINAVSTVLGVPEGSICQKGRHRNEARVVTIYLARKYCEETNTTIGKVFGISGTHVSYVSKRVEERLKRDRSASRQIDKIEKNLFSEA